MSHVASPNRIDCPISDEELRRLYVDEQMTVQQIAEHLDQPMPKGTSRVGRWLKRAGIPRRKPIDYGERFSEDYTVTLSDEQTAEMKRLYVEDGMSTEEVGKRLGMSARWVWARLNEEGLTRPVTHHNEGVFREVVDREQVPFDTLANGTPLCLDMDVLSCGHKVRTSRNAIQQNMPDKTRRCKRCEKAEAQ